MITTVTGYFKEFSASAESQGNDFGNTKISFEAKTASVDTNNQDRDNHLRSGDFFDAENFRVLKFESESMTKKDDSTFDLKGNMTIKDVTKPLTLNVDIWWRYERPLGKRKSRFQPFR